MKRMLSVMLCAVMLGGLAGCGFFRKQPAENPALPQSSESGAASNQPSRSLSSEELALLQKQAERMTECLVHFAMTPEMHKAILENTVLTLPALDPEILDELIWHFMLASPWYRSDPDFPYAALFQRSEDGYTFYFPVEDVQSMAKQLFGVSDWLPETAQQHYNEEKGRVETPSEVGMYTVYGQTDMESTAEPDGSITVTFQLIDSPGYPALERYGKYRFVFSACQDGEEIYLRLQSCAFVEPAPLLPPEPPDGQLDRSSPPPDFLDEEQKMLYLRAKTIAAAFWLESNYIDEFYADGALSSEPARETYMDGSGNTYSVCTGRYRQWIDFERMMRSLFTEDCFWRLCWMDTSSMVFFERYDGLLSYNQATNAGRPKEILQDEYQCIDQTDEMISFEVTRHYVFDDGIAVVATYPMRMVMTEKGWRFDEFGISPK